MVQASWACVLWQIVCSLMADDAKQKALTDARRAQSKFERTQTKLDQEAQARRKSFERARKAGATLREIADAAGLHWTRIREILGAK
jgi:hypothetical protein